MTASEYQDRAQACLDLIVTTPRRQQFALLKIAEAWLQLADAALSREESDLGQNAPTPAECSETMGGSTVAKPK